MSPRRANRIKNGPMLGNRRKGMDELEGNTRSYSKTELYEGRLKKVVLKLSSENIKRLLNPLYAFIQYHCPHCGSVYSNETSWRKRVVRQNQPY